MGVGGALAGAAMDKARLKSMLKGRTPEQQQAIKYFYGSGGCLAKKVSDSEYESLVMAKAKSFDVKKKALDKIGLDESQVNEVAPVHFEDYCFDKSDSKDLQTRRGDDNLWRSSAYQITWIFFSSTQVYVYQYTFNMMDDGKKEKTEEYFYKDVTNFNTTSDTVEGKWLKFGGCMGTKITEERENLETNRFQLSAMGDKFYCALKQNDYTEKAIQGMKAKLREKKG